MVERVQEIASVYRFTGRAVRLVWATSRSLFLVLLGATLLAGAIPAAMAWVGAQLVDSVLLVASGGAAEGIGPLGWLTAEAVLVISLSATSRLLDLCEALLRAQLGHKVNVLILEKALHLTLEQFEDSETYDQMTRARQEASSRPLSLVRRSFGLARNAVTLLTYGALLVAFSPWAVVLLVVASVPSFFAETTFAGEAFRLFRWRSPEKRRQAYLELVVAREDYAKEVMLLGIGPMLVGWYDEIFQRLYAEDRNLTLRRGGWGFGLGLLSVLALYGAYAWVVWAAVGAAITIGQMTMYLVVFRQGQGAFTASLQAVGGMYEDNLYLSNLYEFLEMPVQAARGTRTEGPDPSDGVRFKGVSFSYPGSETPALSRVDLHVPPGRKLALVGHNGSGKTTLIKLLTRLYAPTEGTITLDGLPLEDWSLEALRSRVGVIFQDFVRYQLTVGENIGVGASEHLEDEARLDDASDKGMALPFIDELPERYGTQLGRWFKNGRELSIGQWQKVALSRAFMRTEADVLVLDEPTAAMDAEAEALIFQRLADLSEERMAILISHRFSTVRMADHIVVLDHGEVVERGSHEELMGRQGTYHKLFSLQAEGYR